MTEDGGAGAPTLRTTRLLLRSWDGTDREAFAALNADPVVMEHFPSMLSHEQSDAFVDRSLRSFAERGYGPWAVELVGEAHFIGFVGLVMQTFEAPFTPAVEVGWRLARAHWGRGCATEAAIAALDYGFSEAGVAQVVSMTAVTNQRSQQVMRRLGMRHDPADDFEHPALPEGHPLRRHVLYRLTARQWNERRVAPEV